MFLIDARILGKREDKIRFVDVALSALDVRQAYFESLFAFLALKYKLITPYF